MSEPKKRWYQCRTCKSVFFDYVKPGTPLGTNGLLQDRCNKCSPRFPRYRHKPHPDQGEFDFDQKEPS